MEIAEGAQGPVVLGTFLGPHLKEGEGEDVCRHSKGHGATAWRTPRLLLSTALLAKPGRGDMSFPRPS